MASPLTTRQLRPLYANLVDSCSGEVLEKFEPGGRRGLGQGGDLTLANDVIRVWGQDSGRVEQLHDLFRGGWFPADEKTVLLLPEDTPEEVQVDRSLTKSWSHPLLDFLGNDVYDILRQVHIDQICYE